MYSQLQVRDQHNRSQKRWAELHRYLILSRSIRRSMPGLFTPQEEQRYEDAIQYVEGVGVLVA